jgi:hypothetical protein
MRKLVILTFSFIYISICSAQHTTKRDIDETYFANSITTPDLEAILYN